jgi:PAS domain S-box-containing protein
MPNANEPEKHREGEVQPDGEPSAPGPSVTQARHDELSRTAEQNETSNGNTVDPDAGPVGRNLQDALRWPRPDDRPPVHWDVDVGGNIRAFTAALDAIAEGVSVWDTDDRLVFCNDRFRDAYPAIADLLHPGADLKVVLRTAVKAGQFRIDGPVERWIEDHASGGGTDGGVREQRLDDGRWLLANQRRTPDGGLVWTVSDVTEQKLTEETLALLTRAVEESPSIVVITDPAGTIEYVNPRFTEATGYDADDVIGRSAAILKSRKTSLRDYKRMWSTVGGGEPWRGRLRNRRKDGSEYRTDATISPVRSAGGLITHFVSVEEDLTERLKAEEQARAHRQQLNRYMRIATIGEMGATLAHELNQPITAVVNYCRGSLRRLGSGSWNPGELAEALKEAYGEAQRASEILNNIARFVRPSTQRKDAEDINTIIRSAARLAERDLHRHRIDLELELAPDLPTVTVNAVEIEQILLNLLRNGIDAVAEKRSGQRAITIRSIPLGADNLMISVRDNGRGFPLDVAEHAFDPFFTTKPEGMGMGLAISRSIIETHGGRVWVEANPGGGAGVHFTLPIREVRHVAA